MTSNEARERFSAAYDDMLSADEQAAFDAALAADDALSMEYEELRAVLDEAKALDDEELVAAGADPRALDDARALAADEEGDDDEVDLLHGVQARIRQRSRGRFYRDRFSQRTGNQALMPLLMGVVMLLIIGVAYVMLHHVEEVESGDRALPTQQSTP